MNTILRLVYIAVVAFLALGVVGCNKKSASKGNHPKTVPEALAILQESLTTASPDAQSNFYNGVSYNIRYGNYPKATASLQQIASDPSLTADQKQVVSDLSDLLKQQPDAAAAH